MDDQYTPLQLWAAEKDLLHYFNEINYYSDLIKNDLEGYDQEDIDILAIDIEGTLTAISANFFRGLLESDEHPSLEQVSYHLRWVHDHIILNSDIDFATDIVESEPLISYLQEFLVKQSHKMKKQFLSIGIMAEVKKMVYDISEWAELQYVHQGKDIHDVIASRSNTAINIVTQDPAFDKAPADDRGDIDSTKALRNYFVKDYDGYKLATINTRLNEYGKQKKDGYITKIAALVAVLYYRKALSKTYKATLSLMFARFGILDDPSDYKPAQFKRPSIKGTTPAAWEEATQFYDSL